MRHHWTKHVAQVTTMLSNTQSQLCLNYLVFCYLLYLFIMSIMTCIFFDWLCIKLCVYKDYNNVILMITTVTWLKYFLGLWAQLVGVAVVAVVVVGNETSTCQRQSRVLSECSSGPCEPCLHNDRSCSGMTIMHAVTSIFPTYQKTQSSLGIINFCGVKKSEDSIVPWTLSTVLFSFVKLWCPWANATVYLGKNCPFVIFLLIQSPPPPNEFLNTSH